MGSEYQVQDKNEARVFFNTLRQNFIDWNYKPWNSAEFKAAEKTIDKTYAEKNGTVVPEAKSLLKDGE